MANKPAAFRFNEDFMTRLRTTAFVTGRDQKDILEEAFHEYMDSRPELKQKVEEIIETIQK